MILKAEEAEKALKMKIHPRNARVQRLLVVLQD